MSDELTTTSEETSIQETVPRRKKTILLGLVSAVLIVIIGGGVVLYLRGDIRLPGVSTSFPKVMKKVENGKVKCIDVKEREKCLAELILDEAIAGKQEAACVKIDNADLRDGCYDAIAREARDEKICAGISRPVAAEDCVGATLFVKAKTNVDTALCEKIKSGRWQESCYTYIFGEKGTLEYCQTVGLKRDLCVSIVTSAGEEREEASTEEQDSDADGLTDSEEINIYKTDPKNPDTDGDGFKDGDEVKAKYNPKGAGRLQ